MTFWPLGGLKYDAETLDRMQHLWEDAPELSAARIAERFNVTKNTVIGQASRRYWKPRREPVPDPPTLFDRCDAIDVFPPAGCCLYPIGHPRTEGFRFCCDPVLGIGSPYCHMHDAKCRPVAGRAAA